MVSLRYHNLALHNLKLPIIRTCFISKELVLTFQTNHERNPVEEMQAAAENGTFVFVSNTPEDDEEEKDFKEAEDLPVEQTSQVINHTWSTRILYD